ncbi:hypothetical protein QAD02_004530 [Eretmocerus hayati]|uniref:Uncharacterized protein n=1 Tax=Eretmocerus hayati TaxID=131215 RepID=A0ACC2NQ06_9HYME|nr:hypothetical protein QAD02_004530 [Eretmocerus hayati]
MKFTNEISIVNLNDDCLLHIFEYLALKDRVSLDLVCQRWKRLCSLLWKKVDVFDVCSKEVDYAYSMLKSEDDINVLACEGVFKKCFRNSKIVNLSRIEGLESTTLMDLWHYCSCHFGYQNAPTGTLNTLRNVLLKCERLEELWLCQCVVDVDDVFLSQLFAKNRNLRKLILTEYKLTGECFSNLFVKKLDTLILFGCIIQNRQHLNSAVSRASKLRTLSVSGCSLDPHTLETVNSPVSSRNLKGYDENGFYEYRCGLLYNICKLKNLTILGLRNSGLSDNMMKIISLSCTNLKVLIIDSCERIREDGLRYTASMPNLKCLDIGYIDRIADIGLLGVNKNLHVLRMNYTSFCDIAILRVLSEMKILQELDISGCRHLGDDFVESAIEIVKLRKDKIPLEIGLHDTNVSLMAISNICSLVQLNFDYSVNYEKYC